MSTDTAAKSYWDRAAKANAAWYTATGFDTESDAFFASGAHDTDALLGFLGVHISDRSTVLEIGCGVGRMTKQLADRSAHVIATDVSAEMIARARRNMEGNDKVEFVELPGDGSLPFTNESVDIVFSYITMQHVSTRTVQERYFAEAIRVIRPGGWVVIQFRRDGSPKRLRQFAANFVHALRGKKTLSPSWRGARMSENVFRGYRDAHVTVDVLRLDDDHVWALARRVVPR